MIKLKNYDPPLLLHLISTGIGFPFIYAFLFLGNRRWGFDIDMIPMWLLFTSAALFMLSICILVNFMPPKIAAKAGFIGWLFVPIVLVAIMY